MTVYEVLDMLACPNCYGSLSLNKNKLHCEDCQSNYPIRDGIPILLPEAASNKESSEQGKKYQKRYWDLETEAARYQTELTPMAAYKRVTERSLPIRMAKIAAGEIVLDAGCGSGRQLIDISQRNKIIGLDRSFTMLTRARKKANKENSFFVVGDVLSPPFKSGVFNCVISVRLIQHLDINEKINFFFNCHRMLLPNGRINVVTYKKSTLHWWYIKLGSSKIRHIINFPFKLLYVLFNIPAKLLGLSLPKRLSMPIYWHDPKISQFSSEHELTEQLIMAGFSDPWFREFQIGDVFFINRTGMEKLLMKTWEGLLIGYYDLCWKADARNISHPSIIYSYMMMKDKIFVSAVKKNSFE